MRLGLSRCSTSSYPLCIFKSVHVIRAASTTPLLWMTRSHNVDHRASSKLFSDAEHEERTAGVAPTRTGIHRGTTSEHPNWTGDESIEDAVLRMLVDKYKPLRTGAIQTAEEKMHQDSSSLLSSSRPQAYRVDEPLLPAVEGHKPWLTTFKVPSHATASIRYGYIPAVAAASSSSSSTRRAGQGRTDDDRTRRKEREVKKRSEVVGRLTRAKESTLDYRLGITKNIKIGTQTRPNPVSAKGWAGLVEARIERARQEGQFRTIKGRGKPLERGNEEHNPFIAREEFLMNRIVQRQGAAPPWVEIQRELEAAVDAFRSVLKQSWVRRAVRMLTLSREPLRGLSLVDVQELRDREWEGREKAYHESALAEVNTLVRKYNALAPYAVRRAYYVRDVELDRAYEEGAEDIIQELAGRFHGSQVGAGNPKERTAPDEEDERTAMRLQSHENVIRLRDLFRQWFHGRRS